ncbi:unnamed protein product, partial [Lymnaea stagnalis]
MALKLKLHSPVGADPLILKWPVATSEGKEGPEEILDTIRLICDDFPELKIPLESRILKDGDDISSYDYDQTKSLCERYNKAIDSIRLLMKGSPRQKQFSKQASMRQLKHVLQQCYNHSVTDPEKLNHYEPFSPEVYGETSFELVEQMIKSIKFTESDYFIDLGSGVGQVVLQVSAATKCKFCYGVEKAEWPAEYAVGMEREFRRWMNWYGKEHQEFMIEKGDFLHDDIKDKLSKATIVFVNNFAFGPVVDHELKQRFANCLKEGARIVSSKAFCPLNFRITERNLSDIGTIMQVEELSPLCGAVSWTGKPFAYYVHTIDRTLLEKYFNRLKNPSKREEVEPRKDRKGRPVLSIKDKINGALSGGGSDSNSTGRWRRVRGLQRETDSASPLSAAKVLDFDSGSNSSSTNSNVVTPDDSGVVYGPTTRRQWNEYVKRPLSQSGTENDNDSSAADAVQDTKPKEISKQLNLKKKRMKTVKRLNNGALGKRQMQVGKKLIKEPSPVKSKAAVKLRPRKNQVETRNVSGAATSVASSVSTTTHTVSGNPLGHSGGAAIPPSLDSLNLLHAHTIMSTSGQDSAEKISYNDRRMTETSSAYFKPTVHKQTVSMLEKQAGFLQMIETMKQRFLSFLAFMQTPQYRAILLLQIEQEKCKNTELLTKADGLEREISLLQRDGVKLIKDRLKEMGIRADTPRELISQAKDIVLRHRELKSQTASLGAQINALQAEHNQKITAYRNVYDRKTCARQSKNGFSEHPNQVTEKVQVDQHKLLADVDRLHTELQFLQDVNQSYMLQPDCGIDQSHMLQPDYGIREDELEGNEKHQVNGLGRNGSHSNILKEKMDMKENYDTFNEVLATLKKEVTDALQNQAPTYGLNGDMKTDLETKPRTCSEKASPVDRISLGLELKQINGMRPGKYASANVSKVSNNSFKAPEMTMKEVLERTKMPLSSSSWTSEVKDEGLVSNSSPRILPPGTKIDIKKPSKANGLRTLLRGRSSQSGNFTLLQSSESLPSQSTRSNVSRNSITSPTVYTEIEKSAAEELISLKEGVSSPIKDPPPSQPGVVYKQSQPRTIVKNHSPSVQRPAILIQQNLQKGSTTRGSNSSGGKDAAKGAIITSSTSEAFAQVPKASVVQQQLSSSGLIAGLSKHVLSSASSGLDRTVPHIVCNLPVLPINGLLKHKSSELPINTPAKIRSVETKNDVRVASTPSLLQQTPMLPSTSSLLQQTPMIRTSHPGQTSSLAQILTSNSEHSRILSSTSFLNGSIGQLVGSNGTRGPAAGSPPFVSIQSPHAGTVSSNGVQPSFFKILQQQQPHKAGSVLNGTNGLITTTASLASPAAVGHAESLRHTVKLLSPGVMDGKGCPPPFQPSTFQVSDMVGACLTQEESTQKRTKCQKGVATKEGEEAVEAGLGCLDVDFSTACHPGRRQTRRSSARLSQGLPVEPVAKMSKFSEADSNSWMDISEQESAEREGLTVGRSKKSLAVILKREAKLEKMAESTTDGEPQKNERSSFPMCDDGKLDVETDQRLATFEQGAPNEHELSNPSSMIQSDAASTDNMVSEMAGFHQLTTGHQVHGSKDQEVASKLGHGLTLKLDEFEPVSSGDKGAHSVKSCLNEFSQDVQPAKSEADVFRERQIISHNSESLSSRTHISRRDKEYDTRNSRHKQNPPQNDKVGHGETLKVKKRGSQSFVSQIGKISKYSKKSLLPNSEAKNNPLNFSKAHKRSTTSSSPVNKKPCKPHSSDRETCSTLASSKTQSKSSSSGLKEKTASLQRRDGRSKSPSSKKTASTHEEFSASKSGSKHSRSLNNCVKHRSLICEQDGVKKRRSPSPRRVLSKGARKDYSSVKCKAPSPGPPKLERAVSPPVLRKRVLTKGPTEQLFSLGSEKDSLFISHSKRNNKDLKSKPSADKDSLKSFSGKETCKSTFQVSSSRHSRGNKGKSLSPKAEPKNVHSLKQGNCASPYFKTNIEPEEEKGSPRRTQRITCSINSNGREVADQEKKASISHASRKTEGRSQKEAVRERSNHSVKCHSQPRKSHCHSKISTAPQCKEGKLKAVGKNKAGHEEHVKQAVVKSDKKNGQQVEQISQEVCVPKLSQSKQDNLLMNLCLLDSPDSSLTPQSMSQNGHTESVLTPQSMSQNGHMEDDDNTDVVTSCSESESSLCKPKQSHELTAQVIVDTEQTYKSLDSLVGNGATNFSCDVEPFPLPPTPQKTPSPNSSPSSPYNDPNTLISDDQKLSGETVLSTPVSNPAAEISEAQGKKGPQTPPGSPLFNHQSLSRSRSASMSSSSSRASSYDSCHSSSSSSSFSDSSSDEAKKREKRHRLRKNRVKTPPRKLSTLNPPLSLSIGSPPMATVQYSPMPSPNINGFNYCQLRLAMGSNPASGLSNQGIMGGSPVLSPLSVSTQHSPGYQLVTSDSLRSPNGLQRSPNGSGHIKQFNSFQHTMTSPSVAGSSPLSSHLPASDGSSVSCPLSSHLPASDGSSVSCPLSS